MGLKKQEICLEGEEQEPVSPTGQYFNSSVLSVGILAVFESDGPLDESVIRSHLLNVFLNVSPRFSSIMVKDDHGVQQWRKVKVNLDDHVNTPIFPAGLSTESYDHYLQQCLSKIAMDQLPQNQPLWNIHIFNYPTSNAAGTVVFKLHHALGDGFSLLGALFSSVKRADDPSLPLTFPSSTKIAHEDTNIFTRGGRFVSLVLNTASDFAWSMLKSNFIEDDRMAIRSGTDGVESQPIIISSVTFSLDQIRQVKNKLSGTVNDVITGIIFYGIRLYIQSVDQSAKKAQHVTSLVLLNTRTINRYQKLEEMVGPVAESPWGNQFGFIHVSVPECTDAENVDPLYFVSEAKRTITRKRRSLAVYLTGRLLEMMRKLKGPVATAKYIHSTLRNTSMTISNLIGPTDQMVMGDHPIRSYYFMVVGIPQSLTITIVSYMGKLRVAIGTEKEFINNQLLSSCMEKAFARIYEAAQSKPNVESN